MSSVEGVLNGSDCRGTHRSGEVAELLEVSEDRPWCSDEINGIPVEPELLNLLYKTNDAVVREGTDASIREVSTYSFSWEIVWVFRSELAWVDVDSWDTELPSEIVLVAVGEITVES